MAQLTIPQAYEQALQYHRAGRLQEAERLYRQILAQQPAHADAMHLLGVIAYQRGQHDTAVEMIRQAIALQPNFAEAHYNLGGVLRDSGGVGRRDEAIAAFRQALFLNPRYPEALNNLGNILRDQGDLDEAIAMFRQAIALVPHFFEVHNNLGIALMAKGQREEAISAYQKSLALNSHFPEAHYNLGLALQEKGCLDEALAAQQRAVALKPDYAEAHHAMAVILGSQGRLDEAMAADRQALALRADYPEAHCNLGVVLHHRGRLDESIAAIQQAIALRPDYEEAYLCLGVSLAGAGQVTEAIAAFRKALEFKPDYVNAGSNLIYTMHFHPDYNGQAIFEENRRWAQRHAEPLRRFIQSHGNNRSPERRLKIGYVSPDLRMHPVGRCLLPLLASHDHDRFEIFAYAQVANPDALTEQLRRHTDQWRSIVGQSDERVAQLVRHDQIDILVDLSLHMAVNRLLLFARKPAPVQVTWLGYPGTTGLSTMDYRMSDPYLDPPELSDNRYCEETIRLPDTFQCYDTLGAEAPIVPLPALSCGHITFGCMNNFCKINLPLLEMWSEILKQVPNSRLRLLTKAGRHQQHTRDVMARWGIAAERVEFPAKPPTQEGYLDLYNALDIGLDPHPYNGHTTSMDSFWMGVPVVTLVGQTAVGRAGRSQLQNLNLPELIGYSPEEYVRIAVALAKDLPRLAALRATLRTRMEQSPLLDGPRFARNVEAAYREMWRKWCNKTGSLMAQMTIAQSLDLALQHHRGGRLAEAERIYRQILAQQPNHADALHLLGVIAYQAGQFAAAQDLIRRAIILNPGYAEAHYNLGKVLKDLGQLDAVLAAYRQALVVNPNYAEAYSNLGNILREQGHSDDALAAFRRALVLRPDYPEAYNNLGNVLKDQGQLDEALAAFRQAIAQRPNWAEAHSNLANALRDKGSLDEAIVAGRQAVALRPDFPEAHANLGNALNDKGLLEEAIVAYRQAIALRPDFSEAYYNLGNALGGQGFLDAAIAAYRHAITLRSDNPQVYNNLGNMLKDQGQLDEALAAYRQALALKPGLAEAHNNLGNVLKDMGQLDEALTAYRTALEFKPDFVSAHSNLVYTMHFHGGYDAAAIAAEQSIWYQRHAAPYKSFIRPYANERSPERRLRIGYVSPDFRQHPIGRFLLPLLAHHDKQQVEVFAYAQIPKPDALTQRLRSYVDEWRSITGMGDSDVAELIRHDGMDILVDLTMHMENSRLLLFARKPAPVQVTYLAYCSSTGLETMDYRISDPYLDPPGRDKSVYCEQTIRLPQTYWCYQPSTLLEVRDPPALQQGFITLGCLNNFCKVNDQVLSTWAQMLQALPNSQLLLHANPGAHRQRVQEQLQRLGIDPERVQFVGLIPTEKYFEQYHRIDIALDTFPYGGGTTTCDALWMGVPVVSLAGGTAVARGGLSLLSNVGLPELVARTPEEYVRIAVGLAQDLPRLAELRSTLRSRMQGSPLMDGPRFARHVEAAYRAMWRRWCGRQK